ncbi:MAG: dTDP-4-amino-4,6-dideoxygalactose transaminase [Candidatus Aegiribacteria sp.]|nr:dTDP-4-amino-4,6-dideoxygalactose transaminase [Candidatus Aegiribacteria sp.]
MNKTTIRVPFNKPSIIGNEINYIIEAIQNGHISGDGEFTKSCQTLLEKQLEVKKVLLTTSCTHALEMAALLIGLKPGDEVIVPSFTFVSTVNAFVLHGAKPVFIDIRPDTLNLDESCLEKLINRKTKAIVPVHYAGIGCEMDAIMNIASSNGIAVIEDNAHGLYGKYRGRSLGSFGCMATQSFHETKNFYCGEGGALLINDPSLIERAEIIREKGTDRSRFFRGQVDRYTWRDIGSSYLPSDILAAFLLAQLEEKNKVQHTRKFIWEYYFDHLCEWAESYGVKLPFVPAHCEQSYHMFYLLVPSYEARQALISYLRKLGIYSVFHYLPLHLSAKGREHGGNEFDCPVSLDISERILRLPLYNDLTEDNLSYVVNSIRKFDWRY